MKSDAEITNYDPIAERFIEHAGREDSWNNLYERPNTLARLPELEGKDVLDLGCSTGFFTDYVLEKGVKSVTSVDASRKLIERLAGRIKDKRLTTQCADIGSPMPFLKSDFYDVIICSLVIDYVKDWAPMFGEFYRVVKKGGRAVITTGHPFANIYIYSAWVIRRVTLLLKCIEDIWARRGARTF